MPNTCLTGAQHYFQVVNDFNAALCSLREPLTETATVPDRENRH